MAGAQKQPRFLSTDKGIMEIQYLYATEVYSVIKKKTPEICE